MDVGERIVEVGFRYLGVAFDHRYDQEQYPGCSTAVAHFIKESGFALPKIKGREIDQVIELYYLLGDFVPLEGNKTGDLIFFSKNKWLPSHVAIFVEKGTYGQTIVKTDSVLDISPEQGVSIRTLADCKEEHQAEVFDAKRVAAKKVVV